VVVVRGGVAERVVVRVVAPALLLRVVVVVPAVVGVVVRVVAPVLMLKVVVVVPAALASLYVIAPCAVQQTMTNEGVPKVNRQKIAMVCSRMMIPWLLMAASFGGRADCPMFT
jgi:hypothetical protein